MRATNMRILFSAMAVLACAEALALGAASPGEEVIIVYNARTPESKGLAEYCQERRQVPGSQVFGFDLSTSEEVSRKEFEDTLQKPLAKALEEKKLWHIGSLWV